MKSTATIYAAFLERFVALIILVIMFPNLLMIAVLLRFSSDSPILLSDAIVTRHGKVQSYRFRTTGRGSSFFHFFGGLVRELSLDELPGLWAVVTGKIGFKQFLNIGRLGL